MFLLLQQHSLLLYSYLYLVPTILVYFFLSVVSLLELYLSAGIDKTNYMLLCLYLEIHKNLEIQVDHYLLHFQEILEIHYHQAIQMNRQNLENLENQDL